MSEPKVAWGRRLVICCDGTWQSSVSIKDNVPSNVTKLCRLIARVGVDKDDHNRNYHQIVYYDSGIGTGDISAFDARRQGGTGAGLAENVIEAYNFIVQNYEPGDEIFCFGFSRGAYTARAVAGLVGDIGVIKPTDMQFFPELYRLYMTNEEQEDFRKTEQWKAYTHGKLSDYGKEWVKEKGNDVRNIQPDDFETIAKVWAVRPHGDLATEESRKVKVVGVWDTVGSLGVPDMAGISMAWNRKQYGFHNVRLTEHVEHAYQALALDERRKAFRPTLWYIPHDLVNDPDRPTPELKQVWFPGVHINCGGGAQDSLNEMKGDSENLSTATLCWMLQCISPHLTIDRAAFEHYVAQYKRWLYRIRFACTYHHKTLGDKIWSFVPKINVPFVSEKHDEFAPPPSAKPHPHENFDFSWGTGPLVDSYTTMYRLNGTHIRVPGHEEADENDDSPIVITTVTRTGTSTVTRSKPSSPEDKWLTARGPTNEYIHPIVYLRSLVHGWDSHSPLRSAWTRDHWRGADGKERYWWHKNGEKDKCVIPEWAVLPNSSSSPDEYNFERYWYKECEKTKKTLEKLSAVEAFGPNDFLETLDRNIDFGFDNKPQNLWP